MRKAIKTALIVSGLFCFASCHKRLGSDQYMAYVNDAKNGLVKTVVVGQWEYLVQYRPHDYMVMSEQLNIGQINDRLKQLEGTAWFNISFKNTVNNVSSLRADVTSKEMYDERLNYFNNEAVKDISMIYGKDTLYPASYLFENNYNLTPQETMVVGFTLPDKIPLQDMQIIYNDKVYKNGIVKAKITKDAIEHTPSLAL